MNLSYKLVLCIRFVGIIANRSLNALLDFSRTKYKILSKYYQHTPAPISSGLYLSDSLVVLKMALLLHEAYLIYFMTNKDDSIDGLNYLAKFSRLLPLHQDTSVKRDCFLSDVENTTTTSQQNSKPENPTEENVDGNLDPKTSQNENPSEEKGAEQKENSAKVTSENDVCNEKHLKC